MSAFYLLSFSKFTIPTWQFDKILSVRYCHFAVSSPCNTAFCREFMCVVVQRKWWWAQWFLVIILSKFECFPVGFGVAYTSFSTQHFGNDIMLIYGYIYTIFRHKVTQLAQWLRSEGVIPEYWPMLLEKYARNVQNMKMAVVGTSSFMAEIEGNKYIVCVWPPYIYIQPVSMKSRDFLS